MRYDDDRNFQGQNYRRGSERRWNNNQSSFRGGSDRYDRGYEDDRRFETYGDNDSTSFFGGRAGGGYGDERNSDRWSSSRGMDDRYQQNRDFHDRFGSGSETWRSPSGSMPGWESGSRSERSFRDLGRDSGRDFGREFGRDYDREFSRSYGRGENRGVWEQVKDFFGVGPKGYRRSDERIREEASEALARDPSVDASEIEVEVKEGVVHLRGFVPSRWMKRRAEDCVEHLSGVRDVRNEIDVRSEQSIGSSAMNMPSSGAVSTDQTRDSKRKLA